MLWIARWWFRLGVLCTPEGGIDSKFAWTQIPRPCGAALCAVCAATRLSNRRVLTRLLLRQTQKFPAVVEGCCCGLHVGGFGWACFARLKEGLTRNLRGRKFLAPSGPRFARSAPLRGFRTGGFLPDSFSARHKNFRQWWRGVLWLAEREGFEPSIGLPYTRFPSVRLQPLGHFSVFSIVRFVTCSLIRTLQSGDSKPNSLFFDSVANLRFSDGKRWRCLQPLGHFSVFFFGTTSAQLSLCVSFLAVAFNRLSGPWKIHGKGFVAPSLKHPLRGARIIAQGWRRIER